jgi:hypothetical protein
MQIDAGSGQKEEEAVNEIVTLRDIAERIFDS